MRAAHLLSYLRAFARGAQCAHTLGELGSALGQPPLAIAQARQRLLAMGHPALHGPDGIYLGTTRSDRRTARRERHALHRAARRDRHPLRRANRIAPAHQPPR